MAELAQQHTGQGWSSDWKAGKQVRVVDDELDPELCCAGWMAARSDFVSVDILAHAVAESELDDGRWLWRNLREECVWDDIQSSVTCFNSGSTGTKVMKT